jgi:hypothetical protein
VEANALNSGKPSAETVSLLHRYDLDRLAAGQPDEVARQLHQKALATGERNLLFARARRLSAALIFGLPAPRSTQVNVPPLGVFCDYIAFIWAMLVIAGSTIAVV